LKENFPRGLIGGTKKKRGGFGEKVNWGQMATTLGLVVAWAGRGKPKGG